MCWNGVFWLRSSDFVDYEPLVVLPPITEKGSLATSFSAVRGGFEPPVRLPVRQFSKLVVSATHPSHQADPFLTGLQIYKEFIVLQYFLAFRYRPGCFSSYNNP